MVSLSVNLTNDPLTALRATGWNRDQGIHR